MRKGAHRAHSDFVINSSPSVLHSPLAEGVISRAEQVSQLICLVDHHDRVAVDTEADSLHCYREKLCLLQVSLPESDHIVDPLADLDLAPLRSALERSEI